MAAFRSGGFMRHKLSRREFTAAAVALAGQSVFLPATAAIRNPIRIGAVHPYSGPMAIYGRESVRGYELAVDKANSGGGVLGRLIELVRGDASNAQQGIAIIDQLADDVDLFTGTYTSAVSNAASDAAAQIDKIYWDTEAIAQTLTERGLPNFFRSGPNASAFGKGSVDTLINLVAPVLKKDPKAITVWIEHETSIYGTSIAETQVTLLKQSGVRIVGRGSHAADAVDLGDSILRAKRTMPGVWLQTGYTEDGNLLLRTSREVGFNPSVRILVGTGASPENLAAIGASHLEGVLAVVYPRADVNEKFGPGANEFLTAYRRKYGRDPIASESMTCYAGMQMLLDTIQKAGGLSVERVRAAAMSM